MQHALIDYSLLPRDIWNKIIEDEFAFSPKTRIIISMLSKSMRKLILQFELERLFKLDDESQSVTLARIISYLIAQDLNNTARISANAALEETGMLQRLEHLMRHVVIGSENVVMALGILARFRNLTHAERVQYAEANVKCRNDVRRIVAAMHHKRGSSLVYLFPFLNAPTKGLYQLKRDNCYHIMFGDARVYTYRPVNTSIIFHLCIIPHHGYYAGILKRVLRADLTNYSKEDLAADYDAFLGVNKVAEVSVEELQPVHLTPEQALALLPILLEETKSFDANCSYQYSEVILSSFLADLYVNQTRTALDIIIAAFPNTRSDRAYRSLFLLAQKSPELLQDVLRLVEEATKCSNGFVNITVWRCETMALFNNFNQQGQTIMLSYWLRSWYHFNFELVAISSALAFDIFMRYLRTDKLCESKVNFSRLVQLITKLDSADSLRLFGLLCARIKQEGDARNASILLLLLAESAMLCHADPDEITRKLFEVVIPCSPAIDKIREYMVIHQTHLMPAFSSRMLELMIHIVPSHFTVLEMIVFTMRITPEQTSYVIPLLIKLAVNPEAATALLVKFNITTCHPMVDITLQQMIAANLDKSDLLPALLSLKDENYLLTLFPLIHHLFIECRADADQAVLKSVFSSFFRSNQHLPLSIIIEYRDCIIDTFLNTNPERFDFKTIDNILVCMIERYKLQPKLLIEAVEDYVCDERLLESINTAKITPFYRSIDALKILCQTFTGDDQSEVIDLMLLITRYYQINGNYNLTSVISLFDNRQALQYFELTRLKHVDAFTSNYDAVIYLKIIVTLRGKIDDALLNAELVSCLHANLRYFGDELCRILSVNLSTDIDTLRDEDINALYRLIIEDRQLYRFCIPLLPRLSDEQITLFIGKLKHNRLYGMTKRDYASIIAGCIKYFESMDKQVHLCHIATSPDALAMIPFNISNFENRLPAYSVCIYAGFFLTPFIEKPVVSFGTDTATLIAVLIDYCLKINTSRFTPLQKRHYANGLFLSLLTQERSDFPAPARAALCLLVAAELCSRWNDPALQYLVTDQSLATLCARFQAQLDKINTFDIISELAKANHTHARYALIYLIEQHPENTENYIKTYCQSVTDPKRIKELTASLEAHYRKLHPHSSTMFTQPQIPATILIILKSFKSTHKKRRLG